MSDRAPTGADGGAPRGPVIITGPGRSGTTLLTRVMASHPDLAWFSGLNDRSPRHPSVSLVSRVADLPLPAAWRDKIPWFPVAGETYGVWNTYFAGFSIADRDWGPGDVSEGDVFHFREFVRSVTRWQGKQRFMTKITGWPRVELLRHILPGVAIVHIDRDPRAVVASWIKQGWLGYKRDRVAQSRLGDDELVQLYADNYLRKWQALQPYLGASDVIPLRYEDLCGNFATTMYNLLERLHLAAGPRISRVIERTVVNPAGGDWADQLGDPLAEKMTRHLKAAVTGGGYPLEPAQPVQMPADGERLRSERG